MIFFFFFFFFFIDYMHDGIIRNQCDAIVSSVRQLVCLRPGMHLYDLYIIILFDKHTEVPTKP